MLSAALATPFLIVDEYKVANVFISQLCNFPSKSTIRLEPESCCTVAARLVPTHRLWHC